MLRVTLVSCKGDFGFKHSVWGVHRCLPRCRIISQSVWKPLFKSVSTKNSRWLHEVSYNLKRFFIQAGPRPLVWINTAVSVSLHFLLSVYHKVQENGFKCLEPQTKSTRIILCSWFSIHIVLNLGTTEDRKIKNTEPVRTAKQNVNWITLLLFLSEYFCYLGQVYSRNQSNRQQILMV